MMRALVDTNILLDILFQRQPFVENAAAIWLACEQGRFEGYISAITPVNIFYIAHKRVGSDQARDLVAAVLTIFRVCPLEHKDLSVALNLPVRDYEDAVQVASAQAIGLDMVITRNVDDFTGVAMQVL